jgi:hypothetical protein
MGEMRNACKFLAKKLKKSGRLGHIWEDIIKMALNN